MHDVAVNSRKEREYPLPRKANDCIPDPSSFKPPSKLFDDFWREGDLALFFGPTATGKSILAVQIADAIARGTAIEGFEMPADRRRVLYVDMLHSDVQFHMRRTGEDGRCYRFSENLHRDRPPDGTDLVEWLRDVVRERNYRAVVIDDLSAIRSAFDGTRETLKLMRELKGLTAEFGLSILVLTQSRQPRPGELPGEASLMRSRVLCDVADSIFAIGRQHGQREWHFLIQVRSRSGPIRWHANDCPFARITRRDDGLLVMAFDDRFVAKLDPETLELVRLVKGLKEENHSVREISLRTGISRSRVGRLLKKWRPSHGLPTDENEDGEFVDVIDAAGETDENTDETWRDDGWQPREEAYPGEDTVEMGSGRDLSPDRGPQLPETQLEVFYQCGCRPGTNKTGAHVWIESERDGRPLITYEPNLEKFIRWKYGLYGRSGTAVDGPVCMLMETG